jgi:two-component system NtrC family response regulator
LLANSFLERYKVIFSRKIKGLSKSSIDAIEKYHWPGNVRELENKIQKAIITATTNIIEPVHLGLEDHMEGEGENEHLQYKGMTIREARKKLEIDLIEIAIDKHQGNIKRAAEELGISRPTLYDLIDKYKLRIKNNGKSKS